MIEWIITSSILIALIIGLRALLKGKISLRLQYALWALVLLRLLIPVQLGASRYNVLTLTQTLTTFAPSPTFSNEEITIPETQPITEMTQPELPSIPAIPETQVPVTAPDSTVQWTYPFTVHQTLFLIWILGMVCVAGITLWANLRFFQQLKRTRAEMSCHCKLPVYIACVESPCLFGLLHPCIYLPEDCIEDEAALNHVLAHELSHYKHADHVWAVLRCICLALHWYNPLVWVAAKLSKKDAELACDEAAVRSLGEAHRADYGKTLIRLSCAKHNNDLLTATTMDADKQTLKDRILFIAKHPQTTSIMLICVISVVALVIALTFTGISQSVTTTGRLVYYNGNLYGIKQAPSKLYSSYTVTVQEDMEHSTSIQSQGTEMLLTDVGTIVKLDANKIPSRHLHSNCFQEGTHVYAFENNDERIYVEVPWESDNVYFILSKVTRTEVQENPVLTMNKLRSLIHFDTHTLLLTDLQPYRHYDKNDVYFQLFFEIGDSDHCLRLADTDADGVPEAVMLYSYQLGYNIDPRYDDLEEFLSIGPSPQIPKPDPPVFNDGGIEGCFLFAGTKLYVWDYCADITVPRSETAQLAGEVVYNDIHTIPSQPLHACRLEEGTSLFYDSYEKCYYSQPAPNGSEEEYGKFVPVSECDQWWQPSTVQAGYYALFSEENRDATYLYLDNTGAGKYLISGFECDIAVRNHSLFISRNFHWGYRIDGNVLTTTRNSAIWTYLYVGTQKPVLPVSDVIPAGQYRISYEYGATEQTNAEYDYFKLDRSGNGNMIWQGSTFPVKVIQGELYINNKRTPVYYDHEQGGGILALQTENSTAILVFRKNLSIPDSDSGSADGNEIAYYEKLFAPTDQGMDYSRTLADAHGRSDMDLRRFFFNGIAGNPPPNDEELAYLIEQGFDPMYGIGRIYPYQIESCLQKYYGISMSECELKGLQDFIYYDGSYFYNHTGNEQITIRILQITNPEGAHPILLYVYTNHCMPQYEDVVMETMLEIREDGTVIVLYNLPTDYQSVE